ncbi:MAG: glutathione S-transferase family protein [Leptolyngbyaceae cyanobacterium SL_5_9]|nr:glutathione S-transferase family protein [Leptolyngbyaceae cyanobacterium SL_5_9]NJO75470.1 glutathione S-transferase family protein [Leptolyngbyaceae cyanobacterium RM1_406_9]
MLRFYFHHTPNPLKVALFLEESGLPYEVVPVDVFKGEQHTAEYSAINPNGKVPAIVDGSTVVFDSNAILLYLGEKTGQFMGDAGDRGQLYSWLMFVATGVGPFSGQAVHFQHMAPEQLPYAINRYRREVERHYGVLNHRLQNQQYVVGDDYTIVDMAVWGWIERFPRVLGEDALDEFPHLKAWYERVNARSAVERARSVGKDISFKMDFDEETRRSLLPQNYPKTGVKVK